MQESLPSPIRKYYGIGAFFCLMAGIRGTAVEYRKEATTCRVTTVRGETLRMSTVAAGSHRAALLQHSPLFAGITPSDCAQIVALAEERSFTRRQTVFFAGDSIRHLLLLTSGCVKIMQVGPSGSEVILRVVGPGEIVGDLSSGLRENHNSSAQTLQASKALVWDVTSFENLCERFSALRRNMLRVVGNRLREMNERFREISTEKVELRLSSQLGRLLTQIGRPADGGIEIGLSREELAQLTGTTLFTVSRTLSRWEEQGIVKPRREAVLVRDPQALEQLTEDR